MELEVQKSRAGLVSVSTAEKEPFRHLEIGFVGQAGLSMEQNERALRSQRSSVVSPSRNTATTSCYY